jgi:hypothetical protein
MEEDSLVWEQILNKCKKDGDCLVYTGSMRSSKQQIFPDFKHNRKRYSVYKIAYQEQNNTICEKNIKYEFLCDNRRCISKDHLLVSYPVTNFDPEYAWKIIKGNIEINDEECWLWKGYISESGYGAIPIFGRKYQVHSLAIFLKLELEDFPVDDLGRKLIACHRCRNRHCCNPDHVELGTHQENNSDDKRRDGTLLSGEAHPNAEISEQLAYKIKNSWRNMKSLEYMTQPKRAELFGVTLYIVSSIDKGNSWRHIPWEDNYREKVVLDRLDKISKKFKKSVKQAYIDGFTLNDYDILKEKITKKSVIQILFILFLV